MSDTHDDAMTPKTSDDLGLRIDAVQDLIRLLVIAPASQSDDELPRTSATLLHLSQRLGRLLAQAGMTDCVRAAATLERASADLPSDESLRNIDAVLVYLRARLLHVALPSQTFGPNTVSDTAPDTAQATNAPTATNETSNETSADLQWQSQPADATGAADIVAERSLTSPRSGKRTLTGRSMRASFRRRRRR